MRLSISAVLLSLTISAPILQRTDAAEVEACDCKTVGESFLVTRLWNIADPSLTDKDVIDDFDEGFSPKVRELIGFQEYTSASTGDDRTVFFMNVFTTGATAAIAQEAAVDFVTGSELLKDGAITPKEFTGSDIDFHFASEDCVLKDIGGKYLSTRLWKLTEDSNITIQDVVDEFENGYAPIIQEEEGFKEYGGCRVPGTATTFFYNVFDTKEGAASANAGAAKFVNEGALAGQIEKVVFTEGLIDFDYTCVEPPAQDSGAATTTSAMLLAMVAATGMGALLF
jgi:hypothetical protein